MQREWRQVLRIRLVSVTLFYSLLSLSSFCLSTARRVGLILITDTSKTPMTSAYYLDSQSTVDASGERGLMSIALEPQFAQNKYVYIHYSKKSAQYRISRFTHVESTGG